MMERRKPTAYPTLILLLALMLSGCSGLQQSLHDAAMNREISKAGLERDHIEIEEGRIALLRGDNSQGRETLVLVHGFGANNTNWLRLSQYLHEDFYIVAPDLPGHGDSVQDPDLSYRIPEQARRLDAIMEKLDIEQAHVAGNSMGGAVAAVFAAEYPEQVQSLGLIDTAGIHEHPSRLDGLLEKGENPLIVKNHADYDELLDFVMEERPFIPWPISSVMARKAVGNREINARIFNDIRKDAEVDFAGMLSGIKVPTLVLWGSEDRVISVRNASLVAEALPNSRLEILEGIGHVPMLEAPERTADLIREVAEEAQ
ncbi:pimeloyl-ACP methyl ester carboxylesterase [Halospina denitrificans]|uniref:Pimeloyl-ACP methyl ester carboxylesterase n=1 Tax=Halospina denitrificans TaxID=332522 RepID=A0A4R7JGW6_9GAMM|nr:alpha/beta fold hydrolase [Halospina denitrificans]TDT37051.1 pimeloyl-ACP methyl ester carboxylesterase [Halospina denitrificans]